MNLEPRHATRPPDAQPSEPGLEFLSPPQRADELGRLGPYRVLKVLGHGGMGVVFLADDPALRRTIALKVMLPQVSQRRSASERFLREARAAAGLQHDHIVPIYLVSEDRGVPFIAMPFLKGMSLDDYLRRKGTLTIPQILRVGREVAKGLAAAHDKGLVHRDIKPANLWLDGSAGGRVKILDFGLAHVAEEPEHLTQEGAILGTPAYMSPEQAAGKPVGPASDLFSLGSVLYELCTGRRPFIGPNGLAVLTAVATETPPPVQELNPSVPPEIAELIAQLMAKDPLRRPASARAVAETIYAVERKRLIEKLEREANPGLNTIGGSYAVNLNPEESLDSCFNFEPQPDPVSRRMRSRQSTSGWLVAATVLLAVVIAVIALRRVKDAPAVVAGPSNRAAPSDGPRPFRELTNRPEAPLPGFTQLPLDQLTLRDWEFRDLRNGDWLDANKGRFKIVREGDENVLVSTAPDARLNSKRLLKGNYHLRFEYKLGPLSEKVRLGFHADAHENAGCYLGLSEPGEITVFTKQPAKGPTPWVRRCSRATWDGQQWTTVGNPLTTRGSQAKGQAISLAPSKTINKDDLWHRCEVYAAGEVVVLVLDQQVLGAIAYIRYYNVESKENRPIKSGFVGFAVPLPGTASFRRIEYRPITEIPDDIKAAVGKLVSSTQSDVKP